MGEVVSPRRTWSARLLLTRLALLEGEDDALVDLAALQLAVGLGGLLHGHGLVRPQAEPALGQEAHRLIEGTGSAFRGGL